MPISTSPRLPWSKIARSCSRLGTDSAGTAQPCCDHHFFGAIVHTFLAGWFLKIAHSYQQSYDAIEYLLEAKDGPSDFGKKHDKLLFRAQLFYFMGEVEAVFGI
jgi:hypothetical protein